MWRGTEKIPHNPPHHPFPRSRYHDGKKAEDFPKDEITTESLIEYTRTIFKKYRSTGAILEAKKIDTLAKEIETAIKQLTDIADAPLREHDTINPKGEVVVLDVAAFEEVKQV